jgi:putative sigma-54 modulation protein
MKIIVSGRNIQLTPAIKQHVVEKLGKLSQHYDFIVDLHVYLSVEKKKSIQDNQRAEVTLHVSGAVLRVSASSSDLYASIDKLAEKVERSLSRHKSKLLHRSINGKHQEDSIRQTQIIEDGHVNENDVDVDELYWIYQDDETLAEAAV